MIPDDHRQVLRQRCVHGPRLRVARQYREVPNISSDHRTTGGRDSPTMGTSQIESNLTHPERQLRHASGTSQILPSKRPPIISILH